MTFARNSCDRLPTTSRAFAKRCVAFRCTPDRFKGYDGASEGPFSLFERSLELLGRLIAASLLVFAINFDVEAYFLVFSWPLDASWAGFLWIFVALGSILAAQRGRFWDFFVTFRARRPNLSKTRHAKNTQKANKTSSFYRFFVRSLLRARRENRPKIIPIALLDRVA